jgi:N-acetylmuramate 1-kinase
MTQRPAPALPDPDVTRVAEAAAEALSVPAATLEVVRLAGHASARAYYRVRTGPLPTARRVVVMVLPEERGKGEEVGSDGGGDELPFLSVGRYLEALGVRVPAVHRVDLDAGLIVLEDLGETTLEDALLASGENPGARRKLYGRAVDQLAFMRRQAELHPDPGALPFQRAFEYDLLRWELDHFLEWGLEADRGVTLGDDEALIVGEAFEAIARRLAELPRGLTHRDYQSRNLMAIAGELAVIDFQDALQGPMVYDLVALLRDSYVVLDRPFVEEMLDRYCDAYRALGGVPPDREELDEQFDLQTVQRKLKDAGRFVFIDRVKGNPDFLPHIPASLAYVAEALERLPELGRAREILVRHVPQLSRTGS